MNTENVDVDGEYNTSTGVYTASGAGFRRFVWELVWFDATNGECFMQVKKNGSVVRGTILEITASSNDSGKTLIYEDTLADTDTITIEGQLPSAGSLRGSGTIYERASLQVIRYI